MPKGHRFPNQILAALSDDEYGHLRTAGRVLPVTFRHLLQKSGERIKTVFFPAYGTVVSTISVMEDGHTVEIALAGHEGVIGLPVALGGDACWGDSLVRVPEGQVMAVPVDIFRRELAKRGRLHHHGRRPTRSPRDRPGSSGRQRALRRQAT